MNASEIKYIRTCVQIRKDQRLREFPELRNTYGPSKPEQYGPEPKYITAARLALEQALAARDASATIIEQWDDEQRAARNDLRRRIQERFQRAEEDVILGGADASLGALLAELDAWRPE